MSVICCMGRRFFERKIDLIISKNDGYKNKFLELFQTVHNKVKKVENNRILRGGDILFATSTHQVN